MHRSCRENRGLEAYPLWNDSGYTRTKEDLALRPRRVLEVFAETEPVLRDSKSISHLYEYVTLSHMWGEHPEKQARLLQSRLLDFQRAVPWHELSLLYQEAVTLSVKLG